MDKIDENITDENITDERHLIDEPLFFTEEEYLLWHKEEQRSSGSEEKAHTVTGKNILDNTLPKKR